MGQYLPPTDWNGTSWQKYIVDWPDSPQWRSLLRGGLASFYVPWVWDTDPTQQELIARTGIAIINRNTVGSEFPPEDNPEEGSMISIVPAPTHTNQNQVIPTAVWTTYGIHALNVQKPQIAGYIHVLGQIKGTTPASTLTYCRLYQDPVNSLAWFFGTNKNSDVAGGMFWIRFPSLFAKEVSSINFEFQLYTQTSAWTIELTTEQHGLRNLRSFVEAA